MSVYNRRLPVYIVLDCSESLAGDAIEAMANGVAALLADLRGDPMALETVCLSVITFASKAEVTPLVDLMKFQAPKLRLGSGTALGAALRLLMTSIDRDVVRTSATQKGDWKPVVVILTDGAPTDDWKAAADRVRTDYATAKANVIAIACGPDADVDLLARITPTVLRAIDLQPGTLRALFRFVSASVSVASTKLDGGSDFAPLPGGALEIARTGGKVPTPNRFVFLHARCIKNKQFYIMRFEKRGQGYESTSTHKIDDFDHASPSAGLSIAASQLGPAPDCPCCGNPSLCVCDCGKLFCSPGGARAKTLHCPWCATSGEYSPSGAGLSIGRGAG